jgi:CrcB protein
LKKREDGLEKTLLIAGAGALGAVSRYGVAAGLNTILGPSSLATFAVNITGTFILGVVATAGVERFGIPVDLRPVITVGFLGAYTTFSTLMLESVTMAEDGRLWESAAWLCGSLILGLAVAVLGMSLGRSL